MKKEKILKILNQSLNQYKEHFLNYSIIFIYEENKVLKWKKTQYVKSNFFHLTGLDSPIKDKNVLYDKIINNQLSEEEFDKKNEGTTLQKLKVILGMHRILYGPSIIGDANRFIGVHLSPDDVVGKHDIVMGFKRGFPQTLLNKNINQCTIKSHKTLFVLRKNLNDKKYNELLYIQKDINIHILKTIEKDLRNKIDFEKIIK